MYVIDDMKLRYFE